jgi:hypothetical protein
MAGNEDPGSLKLELWRRLYNKLTSSGLEIPKATMEWPLHHA